MFLCLFCSFAFPKDTDVPLYIPVRNSNGEGGKCAKTFLALDLLGLVGPLSVYSDRVK